MNDNEIKKNYLKKIKLIQKYNEFYYNKNTSLVSIMSVNNEIGTIQPIEEIIEICNHNKILFHTDAIQAFGKIDLNYKKYNLWIIKTTNRSTPTR